MSEGTCSHTDMVEEYAVKELYRQIYGMKVGELEWIETISKCEDSDGNKYLTVEVHKVDSRAKRYFKVTLNVEEEPF